MCYYSGGNRHPFVCFAHIFCSANGQNPPVSLTAATLPFKEGEAKVCTFGAIITSSLRDTPSNRGNYLSREPSNQRTFRLYQDIGRPHGVSPTRRNTSFRFSKPPPRLRYNCTAGANLSLASPFRRGGTRRVTERFCELRIAHFKKDAFASFFTQPSAH